MATGARENVVKMVSNTVASVPASAGQHAPVDARVLEHVQRFVAGHSLHAAAASLANGLMARFGCAHVIVGLLQPRALKIIGWSGGAQPDAALGTTRMVREAMDEAIEQQVLLRYPASPGDRPYILLKHAELAREGLGTALCTAPMPHAQGVCGAVTLVRDTAAPWTDLELAEITVLARALGPLLRLKALAEDSTLARMRRDLRTLGTRLRSPGELRLKAAMAVLVLAAAGVFAVPLPEYVTAEARLEGVMQQSLSAPFDGFIENVAVRPGDTVKEGQVLATLATTDLQNEQQRLMAEVARYNAETGDAFAREDRGSLVVAQARAAEAAAQLRLVEHQLTRSRVTAPFDGVVIRGDLYQQTGAPTRRGDTLFVVAPSSAYRIVLDVDDEDVARVRQGMAGRLSLSARPDETLAIRLERLTPLASVVEGRNVFEGHAQLLSSAGGLRPGLQGFAKFALADRPLAMLVAERVSTWLRFVVWKHVG
jgi:multidrug efflux pump subunit AcrA (membrane-fusion protein)